MTQRIWQSLAVGTSVLVPALAQAQDAHPEYGVPIVITGMIGGVLLATAVVLGSFVFSARLHRDRYQFVERLLEKGHPIPPGLFGKFPPLPASDQRRVDLRRGFLLLGWGVGVALLFYFGFGQLRAAAWGLLFLALSVASFVNAYFVDRDRTDGK